jgi:hypothetical protein
MYASQMKIVKTGRKKNVANGRFEISTPISLVDYAQFFHSLPFGVEIQLE